MAACRKSNHLGFFFELVFFVLLLELFCHSVAPDPPFLESLRCSVAVTISQSAYFSLVVSIIIVWNGRCDYSLLWLPPDLPPRPNCRCEQRLHFCGAGAGAFLNPPLLQRPQLNPPMCG